jgi:uncharacterized protein (TIGR03118 family)
VALSSSSRKTGAASRCRHCRPSLEHLEDRFLLSGGFDQVNLVSDVPGLAFITDPSLINPWGIAFSPTGPLWFALNGSGSSDLVDGRGQPVALAGGLTSANAGMSPTGTVFNGGDGFDLWGNGLSAPSRFLFAGEDGTISGWSEVVDPSRAILVVDNSSLGARYTGLSLAVDSAGHPLLYAADFGRGTIDVFDQDFRQVLHQGSFQDASLPDGFAPFNVQNIDNLLYVTYARQGDHGRDEVMGAGQGFIDVYRTDGTLVRRLASGGALDAPWGIAQAPAGFGSFGGDLLVGNNGDGHISVYDPSSGAFLGQLADDRGMPIAIPSLWALTFGNGHEGGDANTLFFASGVEDEAHGLFGALQAGNQRGADTTGTGTFDPSAPGEPDDYPLPPRNGPAFVTSNEARFAPIAELLPMRASSLALVPTLTTIPEAATRSDTPLAPGVLVAITSSTSSLAAVPVPTGPGDEAVALSTFLDLNAVEQLPSMKTDPVEGVYVSSTTRADPGEPPAPLQADAAGAAAPVENRTEEGDDPAGTVKTDESRHRDRWKILTAIVLLGSIPWLWTRRLTRKVASPLSDCNLRAR